jgi:hypothetical protein
LRLAADIKQLILENPDIDAKILRFSWLLRIGAAAFRSRHHTSSIGSFVNSTLPSRWLGKGLQASL